jgi:hypothetical protein
VSINLLRNSGLAGRNEFAQPNQFNGCAEKFGEIERLVVAFGLRVCSNEGILLQRRPPQVVEELRETRVR